MEESVLEGGERSFRRGHAERKCCSPLRYGRWNGERHAIIRRERYAEEQTRWPAGELESAALRIWKMEAVAATLEEQLASCQRSRRGMMFTIRPEVVARPYQASEVWLTQMPAGTAPTRCQALEDALWEALNVHQPCCI